MGEKAWDHRVMGGLYQRINLLVTYHSASWGKTYDLGSANHAHSGVTTGEKKNLENGEKLRDTGRRAKKRKDMPLYDLIKYTQLGSDYIQRNFFF